MNNLDKSQVEKIIKLINDNIDCLTHEVKIKYYSILNEKATLDEDILNRKLPQSGVEKFYGDGSECWKYGKTYKDIFDVIKNSDNIDKNDLNVMDEICNPPDMDKLEEYWCHDVYHKEHICPRAFIEFYIHVKNNNL